MSTPQGSTATGPRRPGTVPCGERLRDDRDQIEEPRPANVIGRERGWARSVPCSVTTCARARAARDGHATNRSGHERCRRASSLRRRRDAARPRPQIGRRLLRGRTRTPPPRPPRSAAGPAPGRGRSAQRGPLRTRVHVGNDQGAHGRVRASVVCGATAVGSDTMADAVAALSPELPVAVFDSGVGGLTVLHELLVSLRPRTTSIWVTRRASPTGNAASRAPAVRGPDRRTPARPDGASPGSGPRRQAARGGLQRRQLGCPRHARAPSRATGQDIDVIGVVGPATQLAVAQAATDASGCSPRRPPWPPAPMSPRWAADRHVQVEAVACPDLAPIIQGGFPSTKRWWPRCVGTARRCARPGWTR